MVAYIIENGIHYIADNSVGFFVKGTKEAFNALGFKGIKSCYQVHWRINKNSLPVKKPDPESEDEDDVNKPDPESEDEDDVKKPDPESEDKDDGLPYPPNLIDGRKSSYEESDDNNNYAQPPSKVGDELDKGTSGEDSV